MENIRKSSFIEIKGNVTIKKYSSKGVLLGVYRNHNTITSSLAFGLVSFLASSFNADNINSANNYIPIYMIVGSNNSLDNASSGFIRDQLVDRIGSGQYPVTSKEVNLLNTSGAGTVSIRCYIQPGAFGNNVTVSIGEVGLVSANGSLLSRVPLKNGAVSVSSSQGIDIIWNISIQPVDD